MKRELGIARCGLACCLCSENVKCNGCYSDNCPDYTQCENRKCSIEKELLGCYDCEMDCKRGLLNKIKPYGFTLFIKRYGVEKLLDCLEENEKRGIQYHRKRIRGDYDDFDDVEKLIEFIRTGRRQILIYLLTVLTFLYFQGFAVCPASKYVSFSLVFALISKLQGKVFVIQFF